MEHVPLLSPEAIQKRKAIHEIVAAYRLRTTRLETLLRKYDLIRPGTTHTELTGILLSDELSESVISELHSEANHLLSLMTESERLYALDRALR